MATIHDLKLSQFLYNDSNSAVSGWDKHDAGMLCALLRHFDEIVIVRD